jgi:hypothetical protein
VTKILGNNYQFLRYIQIVWRFSCTPFSSSWTYWEEIFNMTFDWSNGKVKIQHYVKTNPMRKLKIIMTFKIYPTSTPGWSIFSLTEISACVYHSATLWNTIYYFLVYEMEMPHYNLKYNYWKRYTISRHHITTQTFCVPLIGAYTKSSYGRGGTTIFTSTFFCNFIFSLFQ